MQKISPFLWFDSQAKAAMQFYTSTFPNSKIISITGYPEGVHVPMQDTKDKVLTGVFELEGQQFMALDGGPVFKFNPAVSFFVNCATEQELDDLWAKLVDGGFVMMELQQYPFSPKFGWLADKYGVSWQLNLAASPQKITPFLMFVGDQYGKAEEAIHFYTSIFENSRIEQVQHGEGGKVQYGLFRLNGQPFMAMEDNESHDFTFNEAISFYVECDTQAEIDRLWTALSAVPEAEQCGWVKDRYGVSWQIVPAILPELMTGPDPEKSKRAMNALLQMKKLDIEALQKAYAG